MAALTAICNSGVATYSLVPWNFIIASNKIDRIHKFPAVYRHHGT
jgi:hypothetical protein